MEDSADIELNEEIVGNPAYSSSSDTSKSDPVSFQFKEPRQTKCREEYFLANLARRPTRSRPDLSIISHALAGKIVKSRDLATRLSSVGVLERSFMTIVQYWRPLQIHLYSTHLQQNFRTRHFCDTGTQGGANVKHFHTRQVCDTTCSLIASANIDAIQSELKIYCRLENDVKLP